MASNLTNQVRNIAEVTTAVARGDLSKKITVDVKGEILELKNTINVMVDQLNAFASEVTRVAREVGTEGKLGGQAEVHGVAGTWAGEVRRHQVDVVGEVLPHPGDLDDLGLAAKLALGADFAGNAGHFRGEHAQLLDHRVDDVGGLQELAAQRPAVDIEFHGLQQVALGDGGDRAGHFTGRP